MLAAVADVVLSSAKLKRSYSFNVESRSLRNIFNNIGPSIGPCGTPDSNVRKSLKTLFKILIYESNCFKTEAVGM